MTMIRRPALLACLAAAAATAAAACGAVEPMPGEPTGDPTDDPTDPTDPPTDPGTPEPLARGALQFAGAQAARTQAVVGTATDNVTLEAWIRWDGGDALQAVAYNGDSSTSGYGLYVLNANPRVLVAGRGFIRCTSCVLQPGAWTHVAAVRDRGVWTIYQDGVAGALTGTTTLAPAAPAGAFSVGASPSGGETFRGAIDEVRAWAVARTAQELGRDRTVSLRGSEAGLVAYYRLDEGTGNLSRDATPGGRDLEISGSPAWIASGAPLATTAP